ncbi:MAG: CysB family HTH-type transcriptional regulator [Alistipes senegalensis]|nr:CysB family HTH-type transcriptional regulator [Oxalobacter formigenes]MCM1281438.1 CysB family HTH-type transcriptional regulator [Alistipes senegalensis]
MNLHQLRFVREAVRQHFNLTEAARALYTSQPGVSKAIIELEDELGVEIFQRHGKRIRGLTEPGEAILRSVERILHEIDSLRQIAREFTIHDTGSLTIATSYAEARYFLPKTISRFVVRFPRVRLSMLQGTAQQLVEYVQDGTADVALMMEQEGEMDTIFGVPFSQWEYSLIVPHGHPLAQAGLVTLEDVAAYPLVTYEQSFPGRKRIERIFMQRGLKPEIPVSALTADVIKAYVELGMGVGLIVGLAYDSERDRHLHAIPAGHLFGTGHSRLLMRRNAYLRGYVYAFMEMLSPLLTRDMIDEALSGNGGAATYEI